MAIPPPLRLGYSGTYALHGQESQTGLPRTADSTDGVRTPLYTGGCYECAGPPSILACLTTDAVLALEPKGSSSSASLTIRNDEALLTLSIPIISHRRVGVLLAVLRFTECSAPHRCR
jgi:hypothetical protein